MTGRLHCPAETSGASLPLLCHPSDLLSLLASGGGSEDDWPHHKKWGRWRASPSRLYEQQPLPLPRPHRTPWEPWRWMSVCVECHNPSHARQESENGEQDRITASCCFAIWSCIFHEIPARGPCLLLHKNVITLCPQHQGSCPSFNNKNCIL